jgi:hypothetical protein
MTHGPRAARAGTSIPLRFSDGSGTWRKKAAEIAGSISGLVQSGQCLWVASDQTASIERLTADDADRPAAYADHRSYRLGDFVTLPQTGEKADTEVDLEGIDLQWRSKDTGFLYLVGSHSKARKRVDDDDGQHNAFDKLRTVTLDENRCVLLRIPVIVGAEGLPNLVPSCPDPADKATTITAGRLTDLASAIAEDEHLGPFTGLPGKDNGLDIEGLAVAGDRIYLGLRGPVLRGWACVLQVGVESAGGLTTGRALQLRRNPDPLRKHFLDLGGLGVRDLMVDGDDLVVLAGPTMVLDGPERLLRWPGGAKADAPGLVRAGDIELIYELASGTGNDHAEGIAGISGVDGVRLIVAYDSPAEGRLQHGGDEVLADIFPWP